ncbi:MAG TPA: DNA-formamidopyrimidine glycosylase family protein [Planctomycetota bacterium]|nr:DNA-formamidopyrimidine glycosylase family protein [Planctomycetota bacterium]
MPELPDITVYIAALKERVLKRPLQNVRIASPFLLRSFDPPLSAVLGKPVVDIRRLGKRIVLCFEEELFAVIHLMIAGRLRWALPRAKITAKVGLAAFDFPEGTLLLTEASPKKRASLHVFRGEAALKAQDPGGIEVFDCSLGEFAETLKRENHTIKRSLTDPHLFSGIGNAYSDEILHRAKMSPFRQTSQMTPKEIETLLTATRAVLKDWTERLERERGMGFPENVTAFREGMAVHGRYNQPCPVCGSPVQRIRYAENEANYCATCQTGGKLLADRSLSRLLKDDWPKTLEELEERTAALKALPPIHNSPHPTLSQKGRGKTTDAPSPTRRASIVKKGAQSK